MRSLRSEQGISLAELLVGIAAGIAVLLGTFTVLNGTLRSSARVQQRVDATQRARPVLTKMLDELHSACVSPNVPPVLTGSGDSSITFLHKTGPAVTVNPDKRVITQTGSTISESVYPYSSGTAPNWIFSSTATTTRLLTNAGAATIDGATVPLFRYYAFAANGVIDPVPLPTPLSSINAAKTVQVTISFAASPTKTQVVDANSAAMVTDSALFRFTPAGEDASATNLPCA
jgi:hypothetical protein